MNSSQVKGFLFLVIAGLLGLTGLITLFGSIYVVEDGTRGIKKSWGEAVSVEKPGMGFKVPFKDQIEEVVVRTQSTKISTKAGSIDLQEVTVGASVNWRITESSLLNFYKTIGIDPVVIEEKYIKPKTVSAMKTSSSHSMIHSCSIFSNAFCKLSE